MLYTKLPENITRIFGKKSNANATQGTMISLTPLTSSTALSGMRGTQVTTEFLKAKENNGKQDIAKSAEAIQEEKRIEITDDIKTLCECLGVGSKENPSFSLADLKKAFVNMHPPSILINARIEMPKSIYR